MDWFSVGRQAWLDQVKEEIVEPDLPIIDSHHHLWSYAGVDYLAEQFFRDTNSGHLLKKTVYVECNSEYRESGPEHLKPLGETEFALRQAKQFEKLGGTVIAGIVGYANMRLRDGLEELLDQHMEVSEGRFKGVRHSAARAEYPEALHIPGNAPEGLYQDSEFRNGLKKLGSKGLTFDACHFIRIRILFHWRTPYRIPFWF